MEKLSASSVFTNMLALEQWCRCLSQRNMLVYEKRKKPHDLQSRVMLQLQHMAMSQKCSALLVYRIFQLPLVTTDLLLTHSIDLS